MKIEALESALIETKLRCNRERERVEHRLDPVLEHLTARGLDRGLDRLVLDEVTEVAEGDSTSISKEKNWSVTVVCLEKVTTYDAVIG